MLVAQDFRDRARAALSGNWALAVGTGFVASLLGAYTAFGSGGGSSSGSSTSEEDMEYLASSVPEEVMIAIVAVLAVIAIVAVVYAIIMFIIGGPITLGYVKFNLNLVRGQNPQFRDLFTQFGRLGESLVMQLLRGIFIFLWTLLLIVPGVIASLSYAMAPYILYENPGMSGYEAIQQSKALMDGNKWRLFCLNFSFIGWSLLCILTCGIGIFWLRPYQEAAYAIFYEEIKREKLGAQTVDPYTNPYEQDSTWQ